MKSVFKILLNKRDLIIFFLLIMLFGCQKLVNIEAPVTAINQKNVYQTDATAISVLTGMYTYLSSGYTNFVGYSGLSTFLGLSADELNLWTGVSTPDTRYFYFTNSLHANARESPGSEFWNLYDFGGHIYSCNAAIEGITASTALTPAVKQQLLGEAKFLRAFFYFYLVNLYGDIPLVLTTNYKANASLPRTPKDKIYQQIIADLTDAQTLLSPNYLNGNLQAYPNGSAERVRPTSWAASALLARVRLYTADYADAEKQATIVINNSTMYSLDTLNGVFLKNSSESIWQLQPVVDGHNTEDGWSFIIPNTGLDGGTWSVYLNKNLLGNFESGDMRRVNWVDSVIVSSDTFYFPFKYKSASFGAPVTEYEMMLRLGEQYLIRAEAEAEQGDLSNAEADLNIIRTRAGLSNAKATDQTSILQAILHERQVELFTEWGHRWLDLKRTGNIEAVMQVVTPEKSGGANNWSSYQQLYPIPFTDILADPNLTQNPGY